MNATVLIVAKAPVPGLAKTRLTPPATPRQAARIAAASLLDTLDAASGTGGRVVVALTGRLADAELANLELAAELRTALSHATMLGQHGATLADRLANAHADAAVFARLTATAGPAAFFARLTAAARPADVLARLAAAARPAAVLQVGMDTPQLTAALLAEAAGRLSTVDAVLGPATDGGWWALGLNRPAAADVLRAVPMSRPDTGDRTLDALRRNGLTVGLLPELSDVDTMADAVRVAAQAPGTRFRDAVQAVQGVVIL